MALDSNAQISVISGAWAVPLFKSNLNFTDIRREAARLQDALMERQQQIATLGAALATAEAARDELAAMQGDHGVISTTLLGGRTVVHVYDTASPGTGFEPTEPDLTDVYFSTMSGHIGQLHSHPQPAAAA